MKVRPWGIVILAFLHILEPFFRLMFISNFYGRSANEYLMSLWYSQFPLINIGGLFLFPIAGVAILMFKKWSLLVFLVVELLVGLINVSYLSNLYLAGNYTMMFTTIGFFVLNIIVVTYFLFPSVRRVYEDDNIQWWRQKARYKPLIDCFFVNLEHLGTDQLHNIEGHVTNISESGVFINSTDVPGKGDYCHLRFVYDEKRYDLDCDVVYVDEGRGGFGAKFINLNKEKVAELKYLVDSLSLLDTIEDRSRISLTLSFKEWLKSILRRPTLLLPKNPVDRDKK